MLSKESREVNNRRFAIQYEILSTPIANKKQGGRVNVYELNHGRLSYLWTVIEYIGNEQFVDLLTGEIYVRQLSEDDILDTVTKEYESEAVETKERLLQNPLAIGPYQSRFGAGRVLIKTMDTESKIRIMRDMQKIDEIMKQIQLLKIEAREKINQYYQEKNVKKMLEIQEKAEKENKEFDRKRAREAWEQKQTRLQEEIRDIRTRIEEKVDIKFDSLFPADTAAKILTKSKN